MRGDDGRRGHRARRRLGADRGRARRGRRRRASRPTARRARRPRRRRRHARPRQHAPPPLPDPHAGAGAAGDAVRVAARAATRSGPASTPRPSTPPRATASPSSRCPAARPSSTTTTSSRAGPAGLVEAELRARASSGCALVASRGSMDLGESQGGLPPDRARRGPSTTSSPSTERLAALQDARAQIVVAPCSPFSVTKELMGDSAELARRLGLRLHTHLAETVEEDDYCHRALRLPPVEYLAELGWIDRRRLVRPLRPPLRRRRRARSPARASASRTARRPTSASAPASRACASSSTRRPRRPRRRRLGVERAQRPLFEVKQALLVARGRGGPEAMTARDALRLGTRGGARCSAATTSARSSPASAPTSPSGRTDALELGRRRRPRRGLRPLAPHRVDRLYVGGEEVVRDGHLVDADEDEIAAAPSGPGAKIRRMTSTHVLDTASAACRSASASSSTAATSSSPPRRRTRTAASRDLAEVEPGTYRLVFLAVAVLPPCRARDRARRRH